VIELCITKELRVAILDGSVTTTDITVATLRGHDSILDPCDIIKEADVVLCKRVATRFKTKKFQSSEYRAVANDQWRCELASRNDNRSYQKASSTFCLSCGSALCQARWQGVIKLQRGSPISHFSDTIRLAPKRRSKET
jgi:hypothetical protein